MSDEQRRKMSEQKKGNKYWLGKHHSEESRKKISNAKKGIPNLTNNRKGTHHTEGARQKIREKRKLQIITEEHKKHISEGLIKHYQNVRNTNSEE
jgi:hypothetical protein